METNKETLTNPLPSTRAVELDGFVLVVAVGCDLAMSDPRRVSELSPAELIEAGLSAAGLGWERGRWRIELQVEAGRVVRAVPVVWDDPPLRVTVGRRQLAGPAEERAA